MRYYKYAVTVISGFFWWRVASTHESIYIWVATTKVTENTGPDRLRENTIKPFARRTNEIPVFPDFFEKLKDILEEKQEISA